MKNKGLRYIIQGGIIAAVYAALTLITPIFSYGVGQVRISEALCVLPFFTPAAIPGLFVGCALANLGSPFGIIDIVCGSVATLLAAFATSKVKNKWLAPLPSVLLNGLIVGLMLSTQIPGQAWWAAILYVAGGQAIACYALGMPLLFALDKFRGKLFGETRRKEE